MNRFKIMDWSETGEIDVTDNGKVEISFSKRLQGQLSAVVQERAWNFPRLVHWIDSKIAHHDITKPSAVVFISNALKALEAASGIGIEEMARNKWELRNALRQFISDLRSERQDGEYEALFSAKADQFATSAELSMIFDEHSYSFNQPYAGATKFRKHYTSIVGDLKPSGEEFECAAYIDGMDEVRNWIRNVEQKSSSLWLQLPRQKFYPDFVAMLHDGRILVVEYKGQHLYDAEEPKRQIGAVWAEASGGKCLFCMPTDRNFEIINQTVSRNKLQSG